MANHARQHGDLSVGARFRVMKTVFFIHWICAAVNLRKNMNQSLGRIVRSSAENLHDSEKIMSSQFQENRRELSASEVDKSTPVFFMEWIWPWLWLWKGLQGYVEVLEKERMAHESWGSLLKNWKGYAVVCQYILQLSVNCRSMLSVSTNTPHNKLIRKFTNKKHVEDLSNSQIAKLETQATKYPFQKSNVWSQVSKALAMGRSVE